MSNYKPLPHELTPTPDPNKRRNRKLIFFTMLAGILIGLVIMVLLAELDLTSDYILNKDNICQELVSNATLAGALEMINYTQTTGGIKIYYNGSMVDSDVCEYCNYLNTMETGGK